MVVLIGCFSLLIQVCVHSHGGSRPAADGLPLPKHQSVCGELSKNGAQTSGVGQTQPPDPRHKFGEFTNVQGLSLIVCFYYYENNFYYFL